MEGSMLNVICDNLLLNYCALVGERNIAISLSVCLSACLSASISLEPLDRSSRNFVCRSLWPWLGPPLAAWRYVMYFRFYGWRRVWPYYGPYGDARLAALRYWGGVWCLWMPCCGLVSKNTNAKKYLFVLSPLFSQRLFTAISRQA